MRCQQEEDKDSEEDEDTDRVRQEVVEVLRPSEVGGRGVHGGGRLAGGGSVSWRMG